MGNEDKITEYNEFFSKNYKYLRSFTKSIDTKNDYESLLHNVFLKCRDRIEANGYNGSDYLNFVRVSIMNSYKSDYRNKQKRQIIDVDDQNYYQTIEQALLQNEEFQEQDIERQQQNSYITTMIYEFLDKYYSDKDKFVFKTYYLLKHKHLNYRQLSQATNMSVTSMSNIIKKIKKDLQENLRSYILTGYKMDELIKRVEEILKQDVFHAWEEYKNVYKTVFGRTWSGCKCHKPRLREELQNWYNQNKPK